MHHIATTAHSTFTTPRNFSVGAALSWVVEATKVASQRRALAGLDADALNDLGLTRAQVSAEVSKPFWA